MAQPELVKDIEARVKKSGDTMTGNLIGKYFQSTWLQTTSIADLGSSPSKIAVISNDSWIYYRTPSELANDIGLTGNYVQKSGDIMTGNLKVPNLDIANNICGGFIYGETNSLNFRGGNPTTEKYTNLKIAEDGVYIDNQKIYYPGNKPTPADIGAATADHTHSNYAASSHNHAASAITSGTLGSSRLPTVPVSKGGTGKTSLTSGRYLVGNGTNAVAEKTPANVLTDIGAVNKAGDTMTGSLSIEASPYSDLTLKDKTNNSYTVLRNTAHRTQIMSQSDANNYRALTLHDKNSTEEASNILQIQEIVNGVQSTAYRVYHTGYETTPAKIGAAAASHKHAATDITSGTLAVARGGTGQTTLTPAVGTKGVRQIYAGTSDMTAGSTSLTTGVVYFVYE